MKLGVSYNVFDGEELLGDSILSIRESVDYISVIYQEISNFGDKCSPELLELLEKLKSDGFIDEIIKYIPNISMGGHYNELAKRNLGLSKSRENGCTHHLSMDTDEFYDEIQFEACKAFIIEHNMDSSACQMVTYYKNSNYRLEPKEEYYVSFIVKINDDTNYSLGNRFPVTVDPTRKVNAGKCVIFERDDIEMHHMSYIRKDIRKKLTNSSARGNFANNIENIAQHYDNWVFPNKALTAGVGNIQTDIVETPKLFKISFLDKTIQSHGLSAIDKIYCINLDKREDRWEESKIELDKLNLTDSTTRFSAIDGSLIENKTRLLAGEYGINLTHIKLLEEAIENGYENILIFEDDIQFINDYENINSYLSEVPYDWDMVYLGGNHIHPPRPITNRIGKIEVTYAVHAIIVNRRIFHLLVHHLKGLELQLDVIYTNLKLNSYTFRPSLVTQRAGFSDIQGGFMDYTSHIR